VVGLEPANCGVQGRAAAEAAGLLHVLAPGQTVTYDLELGAIADAATLKQVKKLIAGK